jgi:lysophospholipase L1-like esterase
MLEEDPVDLCIIMAGTCDMTVGARPEEIVEDLRRLHAACHERGVPTVALAPPFAQREPQMNVARLLAQWVQTAPAVLTSANAEDFLPRSTTGFWDSDAIHLSPAGSAALGQKVMAHIMPVLSYLEWGEAATKAAIEVEIQKQRELARPQGVAQAGA